MLSGNLTANGNVDGSIILQGKASIYAIGTFGGGTVQFQISPDKTNWVNLGSALTANGTEVVEGYGYVRANLSGATGPNIDVSIVTDKI